MSDHERFMRAAIEEAAKGKAAGNPAFGAVIVDNGAIVGRGHNLLATTHSPIAHAETEAISRAATTLRRSDFSTCIIYTTAEPCPMCLSAILASGIRSLVIGARRSPADQRWATYTVEKFIAAPFCSGPVSVLRDVLAADCAAVRDG